MKLTLAYCCCILVLAAATDAVEVTAVTDSTFQSLVLDSDIPVLVDFWAPWCGPCRMISPVVEEFAEHYNGKVAVYKVNTDEHPNIARQYGIRSIPVVMIFKGGEKVDEIYGAVPKSILADTVEKHLKKDEE